MKEPPEVKGQNNSITSKLMKKNDGKENHREGRRRGCIIEEQGWEPVRKKVEENPVRKRTINYKENEGREARREEKRKEGRIEGEMSQVRGSEKGY